MATTLIRSSDFAFDKPAGEPCRHLGADFGCTIHADLRGRGMPGCTTYDCFGAGQRVAQETYAGTSWREHPGTAAQMFRVFGVVRALHELLWLLTEAAALASSASQRADLADAVDRIGRLADGTPDRLDGLDVDGQRAAGAAAAAPGRRAGPGRLRRPTLPTWPAPTCSGATCAARTCGARACAGRCWSGPTCAAPTWHSPT